MQCTYQLCENRLQGKEGVSNKLKLHMVKYFMDGLSPCLTLVYHQKLYFGLGPIPKPKPKRVDTVTSVGTMDFFLKKNPQRFWKKNFQL